MNIKEKRQKLKNYAHKIGICYTCRADHAAPDHKQCTTCIKRAADRYISYRDDSLRCSRCGRPIEPENIEKYKTCRTCRTVKAPKYSKNFYKKNKDNPKKCNCCGKGKHSKKYKYCACCRKRAADKYIKIKNR